MGHRSRTSTWAWEPELTANVGNKFADTTKVTMEPLEKETWNVAPELHPRLGDSFGHNKFATMEQKQIGLLFGRGEM